MSGQEGQVPVFAAISGIVLGGDPQGSFAPLFLCSRCSNYVRHAQRGIVEWDDPADAATPASAYVRHQDCQQGLARWMQLDLFLMQLGWNSAAPAAVISRLERQGGTRGVWS